MGPNSGSYSSASLDAAAGNLTLFPVVLATADWARRRAIFVFKVGKNTTHSLLEFFVFIDL